VNTVIHNSKFNNIKVIVTESKRNIYLTFGGWDRQTSMAKGYPDSRLMLKYTRDMIEGFSLCPNPKDILIIGLGGGSLLKYIYKVFPNINIDVIELIPDVVSVAKKYFNIPITNNIMTGDAVDILNSYNKKYDLIMVDTFSSSGIPAKLKTEAFYKQIKLHLKDEGWVVANTWANTNTAPKILNGWKQVYDTVLILDTGKKIAGNLIIFSGNKIPKFNDDYFKKLIPLNNLLLKTNWKKDIQLHGKFIKT